MAAEEAGSRRSSSRGLEIVELDERDAGEWATFVAGSPYGSAYSLPGYVAVLRDVVGGTVRTVVARRGDTIVGGVTAFERSTPLGAFVAPRFLLYYNGFVLRDYETRYPAQSAARHIEVVSALAAHLEASGYGRLEIRSRSPFVDARALLARGWGVSPSYSYVVPLVDLELLWNRTDQNLRRLVERARGLGQRLTVDEDFESFYRLHAETGRRKGAPVYLPRAGFTRYYEQLRDLGLARLFHARTDDGRVAASQLVLLGHPVTHTVCAAADPDLQGTGANAFLRFAVFEHLAELGYAANDLTDAALSPVTRFKSQLGGDLVQSLVAERPQSRTYKAQLRALRGMSRVRRFGRGAS